MKKISLLLSIAFMVFITSGALAQKPGEGRDEPKSDTPVKPPKDKPVISDTESPVKPPKDKPVLTESPVKPPKDKPVLSETESPVKPPKDKPVTSDNDVPTQPMPNAEVEGQVKDPKGKPVKGKGPSSDVINKAEQNSNGNAFSGKGKGGDKNMMDPADKTKQQKKNKKAKKVKKDSRKKTKTGSYNPPPRPMNQNR